MRHSQFTHLAVKGAASGKDAKGEYPAAFRQMAVEWMKRCENIVALSENWEYLGGCYIGSATKLIRSMGL